jgi:hypothetical protein
MPCDMMSGATSGDFAWGAAQDAQRDIRALTQRVAELEQALCGLCQMLERDGLPPELTSKHPQLQQWFERHKKRPGCEAG